MRDTGLPSSGVFVVISMFALLRELGYHPGVRHWSNNLNEMFAPEVAQAGMQISDAYDLYLKSGNKNPFKASYNYISLQVEVGMNYLPDAKAINTSPYGRQFRWMIGLHTYNKHHIYTTNTQESHCIGANHYLGRGHLCSSSGVIPCPQYNYHQLQSKQVTPQNRDTLKRNIILLDTDQGSAVLRMYFPAVLYHARRNEAQCCRCVVNLHVAYRSPYDLYVSVCHTQIISHCVTI